MFLKSVPEKWLFFYSLFIKEWMHDKQSEQSNHSICNLHIVVSLFVALYKSIQNSQTSQDYIFHILKHFAANPHNFTKFRMLIPTACANKLTSNDNFRCKKS